MRTPKLQVRAFGLARTAGVVRLLPQFQGVQPSRRVRFASMSEASETRSFAPALSLSRVAELVKADDRHGAPHDPIEGLGQRVRMHLVAIGVGEDEARIVDTGRGVGGALSSVGCESSGERLGFGAVGAGGCRLRRSRPITGSSPS